MDENPYKSSASVPEKALEQTPDAPLWHWVVFTAAMIALALASELLGLLIQL